MSLKAKLALLLIVIVGVTAAASALTAHWFGNPLLGWLLIVAAALLICGLLADGISANRCLLEDALHRIKRIEASEDGWPAFPRSELVGWFKPALTRNSAPRV